MIFDLTGDGASLFAAGLIGVRTMAYPIFMIVLHLRPGRSARHAADSLSSELPSALRLYPLFLLGFERLIRMNFDPNESVSITLQKSVCLVLFELLARSYEQWRKQNSNDSSAGPMLLKAREHDERLALWRLEGAIERTLPEVFASDYLEIVSKSREFLVTTS